MRYFTLILFLLLNFSTQAQVVRGLVTDNTTGKVLSPVTITNLTTQQGVYNGEDGKYTIAAKPGDKIAFSYLGYKSVEETVPSAIGTPVINIHMVPTAYNLKQVNIYSKEMTQYQKDSLERHSTYKQALNYHKASISSPVSMLAEAFSKSAKQKQRFKNDFPKLEVEHFVDTRYTPELVTELTGFKGDTLGNFMNAYPMEYDYARTASDIELKMWIRYNYKQYLRKLADSASAVKRKEEH